MAAYPTKCDICGADKKLIGVPIVRSAPPALLCRKCKNDLDRQAARYGPVI